MGDADVTCPSDFHSAFVTYSALSVTLLLCQNLMMVFLILSFNLAFIVFPFRCLIACFNLLCYCFSSRPCVASVCHSWLDTLAEDSSFYTGREAIFSFLEFVSCSVLLSLLFVSNNHS